MADLAVYMLSPPLFVGASMTLSALRPFSILARLGRVTRSGRAISGRSVPEGFSFSHMSENVQESISAMPQ